MSLDTEEDNVQPKKKKNNFFHNNFIKFIKKNSNKKLAQCKLI